MRLQRHLEGVLRFVKADMKLQRTIGLVVVAMLAAVPAEANRWKIGNGGCYWATDSGPNQCSCPSGVTWCPNTTTERWRYNAYGYCQLVPEAGSNLCVPAKSSSLDLANRHAAAAGDWKTYGVYIVTSTDSAGKILSVNAPEDRIPKAVDISWTRGLPNIPITGTRLRYIYDVEREIRTKSAAIWGPRLNLVQWTGASMTCNERNQMVSQIDQTMWYFGFMSGGFGGAMVWGYSYGWPATTMNMFRGVQFAIVSQLVLLNRWRYYVSNAPCYTGGFPWMTLTPPRAI